MHTSDPGYSIMDRLLERSVVDQIGHAFAAADVCRTKAGVRHALRIPEVRAVAGHPDLIAFAATFIGGQPIPFKATLFDKSARANWLVAWHQDTSLPFARRVEDLSWGPWSMKGGILHAVAPASALSSIVALRVHLDDSTPANGPLRLLPNSHTRGVLAHDQIQELAAVIAPVACVASAGGVVAMRPLVVHASSKVTDEQPRRVLHIEYAASVQLGPDVRLAVG